MDALIRIKRLVIRDKLIFTDKAIIEMEADALSPELVFEAILNG